MSTEHDNEMSTEHDKVMHCPVCKGRGVITVYEDISGCPWPSGVQDCECVFKRDLLANVRRIWAPLIDAVSVDTSPLLAMVGKSVWLTVTEVQFPAHLRHVAMRQGEHWNARVTTDAALMSAWLSTAKEVFDGDESRRHNELSDDELPSNEFQTLVDLAAPPDLLVIRLGVKAANNKEMANLLVEAIEERRHLGKPTWIVDSPMKSAANANLPCNSDNVLRLLSTFNRVQIAEPTQRVAEVNPDRMSTDRDPPRRRRVIED